MSKLRDGEKKKKELQEENDLILDIGAEGKKGEKNFKEYQKLTETESKIKRDIILNEMEAMNRTRGYHKFLCDLLKERLRTVEFPIGWSHLEAPSDRGVVLEIKSPDGRIFRSAFLAVKDPLYDLNAIDNFAIRTENTIEKHTLIKTPKTKIWTQ